MSARTIDVAYEYLKQAKHSVSFKDLWQEVRTQLNFDDEKAKRKIAQFYTDLSLDARFTALENNEWDLKSHHKFSEVFIDTANLIDEDTDEEEEEEVEQEEEELDLMDDENKDEY